MSSAKQSTKARPEWYAAVKKYSKPSLAKSFWQILNTLIPYAAVWVLMAYFVESNYWVTLALAPLAGLLVVRVFIIFHDCGHYAFFKTAKWNRFWGYMTGMLTFTPFHDWGKDHKLHHATSGNLDKRGFGDIWTMTLQEFQRTTSLERFQYRLYRTPLIVFFIGPILVFTIKQRFTRRHTGSQGKASVHICNLMLLVYTVGLSFLLGQGDFLHGLLLFTMIQLPVIAIAAIAGVWMFYVQHQFEEAYWVHQEDWTLVESALEGSSFYKLPKILQWFTGNIGFHHIHHLSAKIPNYNLEAAYNDSEIFQEIEPITIRKSLQLFHFRLWDEVSKKMVGYKALKQLEQSTIEKPEAVKQH